MTDEPELYTLNQADAPEQGWDRLDNWLSDDSEDCWYCHGEGWGIIGTDWDNDDPLWHDDGDIERCPCCGGSGKAENCQFW